MIASSKFNKSYVIASSRFMISLLVNVRQCQIYGENDINILCFIA